MCGRRLSDDGTLEDDTVSDFAETQSLKGSVTTTVMMSPGFTERSPRSRPCAEPGTESTERSPSRAPGSADAEPQGPEGSKLLAHVPHGLLQEMLAPLGPVLRQLPPCPASPSKPLPPTARPGSGWSGALRMSTAARLAQTPPGLPTLRLAGG